jgi:hypothetical protein
MIGEEKKTPINSLNIWVIISVVLAVILISVLAFAVFQPNILGQFSQGGNKAKMVVISSDDAAVKLVDFINEVYGPRFGLVTLKSAAEESGMYKVTITANDQGQLVDQDVYISKDGKFFIPQAFLITDVLDQWSQVKDQVNNPTESPATPEVQAPAPEATNTLE